MTETLARIEAQGRTMMAEASPSQTRSVGNQEKGSNDPLRWIFRVERYFAVNEISEAERLQAVGQVSTVTVFHEEFEKVSASMKEVSDGMLSRVDVVTGSNIEGDNGDGSKGGGSKLCRGSASNKPVGFRPNYHRVANILESRDSRAGVASCNTDSPVHTTRLASTGLQ
ncbi:hypothetical protein R3W88_033838 [Solanum pinnatisectum]|uniref:Uncharacterized protein n=1 Tax=Solanum pinnatisectum TaxID=50273 RepID=A0AAV9JZV3_9SOLN|nr:hypothetical protein R3W88_033838 [Solanum pinnatisectum]